MTFEKCDCDECFAERESAAAREFLKTYVPDPAVSFKLKCEMWAISFLKKLVGV